MQDHSNKGPAPRDLAFLKKSNNPHTHGPHLVQHQAIAAPLHEYLSMLSPRMPELLTHFRPALSSLIILWAFNHACIAAFFNKHIPNLDLGCHAPICTRDVSMTQTHPASRMPGASSGRLPITLVLDLDETLIFSSGHPCPCDFAIDVTSQHRVYSHTRLQLAHMLPVST